MITFIIGGARSGKSRFAMQLADDYIISKKGGHWGDSVSPTFRKAYIATAQAMDDEMKERIEKHKEERSEEWTTFEEPMNISTLISEINRNYDVILLDCLTFWLSNMLLSGKDVKVETARLIEALRITHHASRIFIVSNEVGLGIVPDNALSRRFRDMAGHLNQTVAAASDEVYLVTAGIPLKIK